MLHQLKYRKGFFTLLGLLLAIAIILFLYYIAFNVYFKKPTADKSTQKSLSEYGLDTSSQQAVFESAKKRVKDIEKQVLNRAKQIESIK